MKRLALSIAIIGLIASLSLVVFSLVLVINAKLPVLQSVVVISFTTVMASFVGSVMLELIRQYR